MLYQLYKKVYSFPVAILIFHLGDVIKAWGNHFDRVWRTNEYARTYIVQMWKNKFRTQMVVSGKWAVLPSSLLYITRSLSAPGAVSVLKAPGIQLC